jgi:hypothetical protein
LSQGIIEVEGLDTAQVSLNTPSFSIPTVINFNSGSISGGFSNYRLINQNDVFRLDLESDLFSSTERIFEIGPSRFAIPQLAGTGTNLLGVNSLGALVRLGTQTKKISLPAQALNTNPSSTNIVESFQGLRWGYSFINFAQFSIAKPNDWDQVSDVVVSIYFATESNANGNIQFFGRARDYNLGDPINDASSVLSNIVSNTGDNELHKVSIVFPANDLSKELWVIALQRNTGSNLAGYQDDVSVLNVTIEYESNL